MGLEGQVSAGRASGGGKVWGAADGRYREKPLARQRYLKSEQQQKITQNRAPNMAPLLS